MSRYYDIKITNQPTGTQTTGAPYREYTSFPGGVNDPGALNVLLDIYTSPVFAIPAPLASVQVWGVPLADLSQASDMIGKQITVYGGFQKGLPLNKPAQAGLLVQGTIYQCFGNWQGTDMTLDFVIAPGGGTSSGPANISFLWTAGTTLSDTLKATLSTAFPAYKQQISVNPKLILAHDEVGFYYTMTQFCQALKGVTQAAIGGSYPGVDIILKENTFIVFDGTTQSSPKQLNFEDLIGQPTYIDNGTIQFSCPMRADLGVTDFVTMPQGFAGVPGAVQTTSALYPQARQKPIFSGNFKISQVHHMGAFRQPDGQSWNTVFNAVQAVQ